jgi:methanogenic corrinoid protein MtbC1
VGGIALAFEGEKRHALYDEFISLLEADDRMGAVRFVLSRLDSGDLDIPAAYSGLLAPSLNHMICDGDEDTCIWKEHIRSSLIRAIIESCYPYVLKQREKTGEPARNRSVLVVCPTEEYHELGARMVADFFSIAGYDVTFIGANTPRRVILSAAKHLQPAYLAISVTNYYNLIDAGQIIEAVRGELGDRIKIVVGGNAFRRNSCAASELGADFELHTYEDIQGLSRGSE